MVRCALDLGLRSCEIANLALADIDWQAGTVRLQHTKSRREDLLPLPPTTGKAIAEYLRFERPASTNPAVFVRHMPPYDVPIGADAVRKVIRVAYLRIGLTHGRTHALRHTPGPSSGGIRGLDQGGGRCAAAPIVEHFPHLRQAR